MDEQAPGQARLKLKLVNKQDGVISRSYLDNPRSPYLRFEHVLVGVYLNPVLPFYAIL